MGIFNYCCAGKTTNGNKCKLYNEEGQDHTEGTIYAVDYDLKKKFPVEYSGYGYAEDNAGNQIYDLGHQDFFTDWDVTLKDRKALFVCSECAKTILEEVTTFDEIEFLVTPEQKLKQESNYLERRLEYVLQQRSRLNKTIKSLRNKLKKNRVKANQVRT